MARPSKTALTVWAPLLLAALHAGAAAQSLPRLHVASLVLRADASHPELEKPFHLIITAHFKESMKSADFVVLPNLAELELLGDERHTLSGPSGTDFTETISVVAHHSGPLHVDPAFFNAVDARDGKPKRFSSNDLTLRVEGGALEDPFAPVRKGAEIFAKSLAALGVVFFFALVFYRGRRTAPSRPQEAVMQVAAPAAPLASLPDRLRDALLELRRGRVRANVMTIRNLLWQHAGAGEGETLSDVLRRMGTQDRALVPVLRLTERAAFIQETFLQGAIDDMTAAIEQYLA